MEEAVQLIRTMWTEKRANFQGKYFQIQDAILEPKPVQKPYPPIMIAGGGEQLTLRAVARWGDACNIQGEPDEVRRKFAILERHCAAEQRHYEDIERTSSVYLLLARDEPALAKKRDRLAVPEASRVVAGTVRQITDLVGRYRDAGVQLLIARAHLNDLETYELLASDIAPAFIRE